jgi:hypothetical protein
MSTLTGQQINQTYDGLLKLSDSTTGITSTYQQIQDGLGNDTNTRISTQGIQSKTIPTIISGLKPDFGGIGFSTASAANVAGIQNKTLNFPFYDAGVNSYSAITYNTITQTTIGDVVSAAFYSLQLVPGIGYAPKDLIMSGISMTVNSTGVKTTTLPSTLSFSGTGGGYYIMAFYFANSGATPVARFSNQTSNLFTTPHGYTSLGYYQNAAGTQTNIGSKYNSATSSLLNLPFQTSYTPAEITTNYTTTITTQGYIGFALNTI